MSTQPINDAFTLKPGLMTDPESGAHMESRRQARKPHYGFMPGESISVVDRNVGFDVIPRACLRLIANHEYLHEDYSLEAQNRDWTEPDPMVSDMKYAGSIAAELVVSYQASHAFTIIDCLIGAEPEVARYIQSVLLPVIPGTLLEVERELKERAPSRIAALPQLSDLAIEQAASFFRLPHYQRESVTARLKSLLEEARQEMLKTVASAKELYSFLTGQSVSEMKKRTLPGNQGIDHIDTRTRQLFEQIGKVAPDDLERQLAEQKQTIVVQAPGIAAAPEVPQIQCEECGTFCNRLTDGRPPKRCKECGEAFEQTAEQASSASPPIAPAPVAAEKAQSVTDYAPNNDEPVSDESPRSSGIPIKAKKR